MTFIEWVSPPGRNEKEEIRKVYVNISQKRRPDGVWIRSFGLFVGDAYKDKDQITEFGGPGVSISLWDPKITFPYDPTEENRSYYFLATVRRVRKRKISKKHKAASKKFIKEVLDPMKNNLRFVLKYEFDESKPPAVPNPHFFGQFVNNHKDRANAEIVCTIKPDDSLFDDNVARDAFIAISARMGETYPPALDEGVFVGWMKAISRHVKIYLAARGPIGMGTELFIAQEKHSRTKPNEFVQQPDVVQQGESFLLEEMIY